ncbi:MAG: sigma-70 family RNA polymerase sigma factor [Ruminiclostridium sp.]|nr:sigma-70 family RNA polymerase sigma factor [Ruminiclostridium sp.]
MLALYMAMVDTDEERSLVERLYTSYEQMMYKAAFSLLKDSYYAEDAVHEAFLRIIRNMSCLNFDDDKKTRALLVITVRNVCFNMLRRNK